MPKLDAYEQELLQSLEAGEWESKGNIPTCLKELQQHLRDWKKKAPENQAMHAAAKKRQWLNQTTTTKVI